MTDDPTSHLIGPPEPDLNVGYGWDDPRKYLDATSPTYWINEFIKGVCGRDVIGEAVAPVTGDWRAYARFGSALAQLGEFTASLGQKVQTGTNVVDMEWDGHAADAAHMYFDDLARMTAGQRRMLRALQDEYYAAAEGVWDYARGAGSLIAVMYDAAILAAVFAAAGTATFKTGIGPVIGYGAAAWQTGRIVKAAMDLNTAYDVAFAGIDIVRGNIVAQLNQPGGEDLARFPLPDSAYDHPAV